MAKKNHHKFAKRQKELKKAKKKQEKLEKKLAKKEENQEPAEGAQENPGAESTDQEQAVSVTPDPPGP